MDVTRHIRLQNPLAKEVRMAQAGTAPCRK